MTLLHFLRADQIQDVCPYCRENISEWKVKFHRELQYEEIECKCGTVSKCMKGILTSGGKEGIEKKLIN